VPEQQLAAAGLDLGAADRMAKKPELVARRPRREAVAPASSEARPSSEVRREAVAPASSGARQEAGAPTSSGGHEAHHQGLEAVEMRWAAVHPGEEG
jgi:hypothetical protein